VQPQLDRVHAASFGQPVHLRFMGEAHLHSAEASHRAARWVVGADAEAFDHGVRHAVRAGREARCVGHHMKARGPVGAPIEHDARLEADDRPVCIRGVAHPDPCRMTMDMAEERLPA